jgi:flagellar biosynthesis protein FliQ
MSPDQAVSLVRATLFTALLIASPMLAIGLVVGVVVSVLQAITQIQEQTLTLIPKIGAMVVAAALLLPWISGQLLTYSAHLFQFGTVP